MYFRLTCYSAALVWITEAFPKVLGLEGTKCVCDEYNKNNSTICKLKVALLSYSQHLPSEGVIVK